MMINFYRKMIKPHSPFQKLVAKLLLLAAIFLPVFGYFIINNSTLDIPSMKLAMTAIISFVLLFFGAFGLVELVSTKLGYPYNKDNSLLRGLKLPGSGNYQAISIFSAAWLAFGAPAYLNSGETDIPITNISGVYINQPFSIEDVNKLGFDLDKVYTYEDHIVFSDPSKPEIEYTVFTDKYTGLVYQVKAHMTLENENDSKEMIAAITSLWDAKYRGNNIGEHTRYHDGIKLYVFNIWSEDVYIKLEDSAALSAVEKRRADIISNKLEMASGNTNEE